MMISFDELAVERPLGSKNNEHLLGLIAREAELHGYEVIRLPLKTKLWRHGPSFIEQGGLRTEIFPSPFSSPFSGEGKLKVCKEWEDLRHNGEPFLVLQESLTREALMPLNFPVYFPEEQREKHEILARSNPKCVIAETGKDRMSGLHPYPFFEDGNIGFPSAYKRGDNALKHLQEAYIEIDSGFEEVDTSQLILRKLGKESGVTLLCAHMDSKYKTPGALDNAAGLYALMNLLPELAKRELNSTLHVVPFNGEENYAIPGQLRYMEYLREREERVRGVINIDSPGFVGSKNAVSFYNIDENKQDLLLGKTKSLERGSQWFAGDHALFAFQSIPCVVATSSNLFEGALDYTHTQEDTPDIVDLSKVHELVADLSSMVGEMDRGEFA